MLSWIARSSFFLSVAAISGAIGLLLAGSQVPGEALAINTASMGDNFFAPQSVVVNVGEAIEWKNDGVLPHTVTADNGSFDSGMKKKGEAFSQVFEASGTFPYHCEFHPEMVGTVVVQAAPQPTAAATAPPPPSGSNPVPQQPAAPAAPAPAAPGAPAAAPGELPVGGGPPMAGTTQGAIALVVAGLAFAALGGGAMTFAARTKQDA